jgi:hypothetical protein
MQRDDSFGVTEARGIARQILQHWCLGKKLFRARSTSQYKSKSAFNVCSTGFSRAASSGTTNGDVASTYAPMDETHVAGAG